ncbi:MAG: hypothetical protein NDF55_04970 [archaeon GB-1867-005]|nr:hypothetical protein [Candidatus Culexmicrobium cathedralense]
MIGADDFLILIKYFLISYVLIWVIAIPLILLVLFVYRILFITNYEVLMGRIPIYLSTAIIYFSAIPSYYISASLYFKKVGRKVTTRFIVGIALAFCGLSMLLDIVFVVIISGINILTYPFNWIYLGVSPVMIMSVYLAGIRSLYGGSMEVWARWVNG